MCVCECGLGKLIRSMEHRDISSFIIQTQETRAMEDTLIADTALITRDRFSASNATAMIMSMLAASAQ